MLIRALAAWFGLLAFAFANGAVRQVWLIRRFGDRNGHAISSLSLSAVIAVFTWFAIGWIHPLTSAEAWVIGLAWVWLTLAFEFLAGHYLFGNPWNKLLADYNVLRGRIWVVVLITTAIAPAIFADLRGLTM